MRQILKLILVILMISPGNGLMGQANFQEGRIITVEGDTLYGLIKDGFIPRNYRLCLFKEDRKADLVKFTPNEIKSYMMAGGKYYASKDVTVKGVQKQVFTRVLLEGDLGLYQKNKDDEVSYYLETAEGELIGLENRNRSFNRESNWVYRGYTTYEESKIPLYKDTLYSLFSDSREVQNQVHNVRYTSKDVMSITKAYVIENCDESDCISYENEFRKNREKFGFFTGVHVSQINFENGGAQSNVHTSAPIGVFYSIPLSFLHERISFQNELIYRRLQYDKLYNMPNETIYEKLKWDVFGVPLSIQYRMSVKRVSPTIGFGKEFGFVVNSDIVALTEGKEDFEEPIITSYEYIYKYQKGGWFIDLGLDYKISEKLSLFSNLRFQRYQNKVISYQYEDQFTFKVADGTAFESYAAALHVGLRF